jgi:hypothetical protein
MLEGYEPVTKWAPIVGRWDVGAGNQITYLGPEQQQQPFPHGICISNFRFSGGEAKLIVRFPAAAMNPPNDISGQLLLGYRSPDQPYICVGLGGYHRAYAITQYEPVRGWRGLVTAGSQENLLSDHDYRLVVRVNGQRIALELDDVRVLEHVLDAPLPDGQLGLFTWGGQRVEFADAAVRKEPGTAFVIMKLSNGYQNLYSEVIQDAVKEFGLLAVYAGDLFGPGVILEEIVQNIVESKIVIAEITEPNENVFYELGYAHALRKPTIILAEEGKKLPFDVSGYRCLFYNNSIAGKRKVEEGLKRYLRAILQEEPLTSVA